MGVRRVRSADEVGEMEKANVAWWFRLRGVIGFVTLGACGLVLLPTLALMRSAPLLWLGLLPAALLLAQGIRELRRMGRPPRVDYGATVPPER